MGKLLTTAAFGLATALLVVSGAHVAQSPAGEAKYIGEARGSQVITSPAGGVALVNSSVLDRIRDANAEVPDPLIAIREQIETGDLVGAELGLTDLLQIDQGNRTARRLLAQVMRATWRSSAASQLLEAVVSSSETSPELPLLREAAEAATLAGDRRRAESAIRRYKRAASRARDKAKEAHAEGLSKQLEGGTPIVFHERPPAARNIDAHKAERANPDRSKGSHQIAVQVADRIVELLKGSNQTLPVSATVNIVTVAASSAAEYTAGGSEAVFGRAVRSVVGVVRVNEQVWRRLYDHQKHEELYGAAALLKASFPNADMTIQVASVSGRRSVVLASAVAPYSKSMDITLHTDAYWDPGRDKIVTEEMQDAEDERKGIRRPGR